MRILVTGGAGFIASHIVDAYIADGHKVVIIDDLSSGRQEFINAKAKFYQTDIRNRKEVEAIIKKEKPQVINHHAAQISVRNSVENPLEDLAINLTGLINLLESSKNIGLEKFIFASSGGVVYGETDDLPTPEIHSPLTPQSPYGITKLAGEHYLHFYYLTYKIPYVSLRYGNVYGPRQNPLGEAGVVAIFSLKLLKGEAPTINGDGLQTRDYVYVGDVVSANRKALTPEKVGVFNIGTGQETNVIKIFDQIQSLTGSKIKAKFGPAKLGEQRRCCLDCRLAKQELGWQPRVALDAGLKQTVEYFRNYGKNS